MSRDIELWVNAKGVTTMTYDVWKSLDHSAICKALGLPTTTINRPKKGKKQR
jgi:hypothetical protein